MWLLVVRHGQTEDNVQGIIQGQKDTPLNEHGRTESRRLAERLKDVQIAEAWSSPLCRASETAEIVLQHHPHTPLHLHDGIKERCLGSMEGRRRARGERAPKDAESGEALTERAGLWFDSFLANHEPPSALPSQHYFFEREYVPRHDSRADHSAEHTRRQVHDHVHQAQHHQEHHERSNQRKHGHSPADDKVIMIVSHGAWISSFLHLIYSNRYRFSIAKHVDHRLSCFNTSIMAVWCEYDERRAKWQGSVESWADVMHLSDMMDQEVKEVVDDVR